VQEVTRVVSRPHKVSVWSPVCATAACQQVHCIGYLETFQNENQMMVGRKRQTEREREKVREGGGKLLQEE